jgi:hypothetical protein
MVAVSTLLTRGARYLTASVTTHRQQSEGHET